MAFVSTAHDRNDCFSHIEEYLRGKNSNFVYHLHELACMLLFRDYFIFLRQYRRTETKRCSVCWRYSAEPVIGYANTPFTRLKKDTETHITLISTQNPLSLVNFPFQPLIFLSLRSFFTCCPPDRGSVLPAQNQQYWSMISCNQSKFLFWCVCVQVFFFFN